MSLFKIPVTNIPQVFQIALAGKEYSMTCKYNSALEGGWLLDFSDAETAVPIIANIPLVTGVNLLDGLGYLGFGGSLYVYTDGDQNAVPTMDNLGVESNLYFETDADV